eukprot:gnl/MRDRNA2_/MRDRNA2_36497_c0_seq1.p1 gnl/MRDRNA2_/MRDRNA2_36497_c0~~gnl/MRDRNA2_/MRDRNA2_36497_c0_seq1.p1  ORF type:complete len:312 (-),score=39.01 gnl/MRDRNA2_/MRDRNA2_36497_c0_seq1:113-1048(-)
MVGQSILKRPAALKRKSPASVETAADRTRKARPGVMYRYSGDEDRDAFITPNKDLLKDLRDTDTQRLLVSNVVVKKRTGKAVKVSAGQILRILCHDGGNSVDFNCWNANDPTEKFWAARTRQYYTPHLTDGARLWSCLPFHRPMATVVHETVQYGKDADGGGCHDILGTKCDPIVHKIITGEIFHFCCHSNLTRGAAEFGLQEKDIHDNINLFQVTGLTRDGYYFTKPCPAEAGDYFDLLAEMDLIVAVSACPHGNMTRKVWGPDAVPDSEIDQICKDITLQVYDAPDGLLAKHGWSPAECIPYTHCPVIS